MPDPTLFDKTCTRCGVLKDALTDYYKSMGCRDGFNGVCKQCQLSTAAKRYARVRGTPRVKQQMARNSRRAHQRRQADPARREAQLQLTRAWRERNRSRVTEQYRSWRLANADKVREKNQRRRARLLNAYVAPVNPDAIWIRDCGACQICQEQVDPTIAWPDRWCGTIDHIIPLAKGGTHEPTNVQLAHHTCNARKNDRLDYRAV